MVQECNRDDKARKGVTSQQFLEKFLFYKGTIVSTVLPSLVPLQRIDDCVEIPHPSLRNS